jgi:AraC-like DNA-binding protein
MAVQAVLEELGIPYQKIELGHAVLERLLTKDELKSLDTALRRYELSLMVNRKKILTQRIKLLIHDLVRKQSEEGTLKLSAYISREMAYDYTYMANLFSEEEGLTIERYYIESRIERAKELMVYEEMSVKEVAYELQYSSVSHFCLQFKKVTNSTPAEFKKQCESGNFVWKVLK